MDLELRVLKLRVLKLQVLEMKFSVPKGTTRNHKVSPATLALQLLKREENLQKSSAKFGLKSKLLT